LTIKNQIIIYMKTIKSFVLFIVITGFTLQLRAQSDLLQSGPMLGYSTMKEAILP